MAINRDDSDSDSDRETMAAHEFAHVKQAMTKLIHSNAEEGRFSKVLDALMPKKAIPLEKREPIEAMRLFIFGCSGPASWKDIDKSIYMQEGTREELLQLAKWWLGMDADGSGKVDQEEFKTCMAKVLPDIVPKIILDGPKDTHALVTAPR